MNFERSCFVPKTSCGVSGFHQETKISQSLDFTMLAMLENKAFKEIKKAADSLGNFVQRHASDKAHFAWKLYVEHEHGNETTCRGRLIESFIRLCDVVHSLMVHTVPPQKFLAFQNKYAVMDMNGFVINLRLKTVAEFIIICNEMRHFMADHSLYNASFERYLNDVDQCGHRHSHGEEILCKELSLRNALERFPVDCITLENLAVVRNFADLNEEDFTIRRCIFAPSFAAWLYENQRLMSEMHARLIE